LSSSCIANIHPSSESASSTVVGSITDNNPIIDSSCLKYDLVLLGLSLLPMIWSSGCEDLYLNVFLDWFACWEPSWASSEATSSWVSEVGSASGLSSDSSIWSGSEVSLVACISTKLSSCSGVSLPGYFSSNLTCTDSSTQSVSELYTLYAFDLSE